MTGRRRFYCHLCGLPFTVIIPCYSPTPVFTNYMVCQFRSSYGTSYSTPASYEGRSLSGGRPAFNKASHRLPLFDWFTITHVFSVLRPNSSSHVTVYRSADKAFFYESRASLKQYFFHLSIRSFSLIITQTYPFCQIVFNFFNSCSCLKNNFFVKSSVRSPLIMRFHRRCLW
jgi:hypothetical protein